MVRVCRPQPRSPSCGCQDQSTGFLAASEEELTRLAARYQDARQIRRLRERPRRAQPLRRAGLGHRGRADPKLAERTTRIMTGLLSPLRYAQVVYLAAPAARRVVTGAAASLPAGSRVVVRELPSATCQVRKCPACAAADHRSHDPAVMRVFITPPYCVRRPLRRTRVHAVGRCALM